MADAAESSTILSIILLSHLHHNDINNKATRSAKDDATGRRAHTYSAKTIPMRSIRERKQRRTPYYYSRRAVDAWPELRETHRWLILCSNNCAHFEESLQIPYLPDRHRHEHQRLEHRPQNHSAIRVLVDCNANHSFQGPLGMESLRNLNKCRNK